MHLGQPHSDHEELLRRLQYHDLTPGNVHVFVNHWYDANGEAAEWGDPVYVDAYDDLGGEVGFAVCDLDAAPVEEQAEFIARQLFA